MDKTKQTLVAALMAGLVVVAGGWFFLISPQRSNVSSLNEQTQTVVKQNSSLQNQIAQLKSESAAVSGAQATLASIARRLPPDPQLANLIDDLKHAADAANVDLQVITPQTPILALTAPAAAVTTAPAASSSPGAKAPRAATPAPTSQLYQIPLTLTVSGNYFDVEMFVHSLEGMQRAMVIDQLALAHGTNAVDTTATGTGTLNASSTPGATPTTTSTSSAPVTTSAKVTSKSTGKSKAGKAGKPGTVAGAQDELNREAQPVNDERSLNVTITGKVFAMYSPAAAAAVAAAAAAVPAAPVAPVTTPAPATTK